MPLPGKYFLAPPSDKPLNIKLFFKNIFAVSGEIVKAPHYLGTSAAFFRSPLGTHLFLSDPKMSMIDANVMVYKQEPPTSLF